RLRRACDGTHSRPFGSQVPHPPHRFPRSGWEHRGPSVTADAIEILIKLVAFDTTSRNSNLALIAWVEDFLLRRGVVSRRVANADGAKANLYALIGPETEGGVVLSGHTDVVPVDGQPWTSDPWTLTERGGKLYGRGAADMKSFIALAL